MILGSILSNMSSGISGAASKGMESKFAKSEGFQMIAGRHDYNRAVRDKYINEYGAGARAGAATSVHIAAGNILGLDYKGQGAMKQAGVVGLRQAFGAATTAPIEAGYRYATGTGDFTTKNGERDIAGIPFI